MNFKKTTFSLMFIQTALFSKDNRKIKETIKRSFIQEPTSFCDLEFKINESRANKDSETDRCSKISDNKSEENSMNDVKRFISESLTNLLEMNREIIYSESSSFEKSSETYSFNIDFDYTQTSYCVANTFLKMRLWYVPSSNIYSLLFLPLNL